MEQTRECIFFSWCLPNPNRTKSLDKFRDIAQWSVASEFVRPVRVKRHQLQGALLSNVLAPRSAPGEEKPLRWREPADQIRVIKARLGPIRKRRLFLNFSYVCPERVLVK